MNNKKDYYKILNVNIFSNIESIKKSYRELAMKYHPDRNDGNEEAHSGARPRAFGKKSRHADMFRRDGESEIQLYGVFNEQARPPMGKGPRGGASKLHNQKVFRSREQILHRRFEAHA